MYYFIIDSDVKPIANADDPKWLEYLYEQYPNGTIEYRAIPTEAQPL